MAITSEAELQAALAGMINTPLLVGTSVATAISQASASLDRRYWRYVGPRDEGMRPICRHLWHQVFDRENSDHQKWLPPVGINCRHWRGAVEGEPGELFSEDRLRETIASGGEEVAKVMKGAHFVTDPTKYAELKVPATPSGRSFIYRRIKDPLTGEWQSVLEFADEAARLRWEQAAWEEAATLAEAQVRIAVLYPGVSFAFGNASLETVNAVLSIFHEMVRKFPGLLDELTTANVLEIEALLAEWQARGLL